MKEKAETKKNQNVSDSSESSDDSHGIPFVETSIRNDSEDKNKEEATDSDGNIEEKVESDDTDSNTNIKKRKKKIRKYVSQFTPQITSSIQWYVRNKLFQKIKIINENHLESNGKILEDVLKIAQVDPNTTTNLNAYLIETRQIIKKAMCSRRGYVKRQIGEQYKGKLSYRIIFEL